MVLIVLLLFTGCGEESKTMEDTIYEYYELLYSGNLEKSQEILEWNNDEASIIEYFASMNRLQKQYNIKGIKDLVFNIHNESNGKGEVTVEIIYEEENQNEIVEVNKIKLNQNRQNQWKITSIRRE